MSAAIFVLAIAVAAFFRFWEFIFDTIRHRLYIMQHVRKVPGPVAFPIIGTLWQMKWKSEDLSKQVKDWGAYYANKGHSMIMHWLGPMPVVGIIRPEAAKIFLEQIERFASSGEEFDIFPYLKRCALDIICETAMGCTVNAQTHHDHPYALAVTKLNEMTFKAIRMPWLRLRFFRYITGFGQKYDSYLKIALDFTKKVIEQKLAEAEDKMSEGRKVFLDMLIEMGRNGELSREDIRQEVDSFMFAGQDTTSTSMGWTLWYLAHNLDCQDIIREELQAVFGDSERNCTNEDLTHLKYLERCIKESLRLRPSAPLISRKVEEDLDINGTLIPKGCSVVIAPLILHTNETVYDNAQKFDPERFTDENCQKRHPYAFIPFSAGPRNCLGQKFALMEEKTVLSWFFRKFKISSTIPCDENLALPEIIMRPLLGFPVRIEKIM